MSEHADKVRWISNAFYSAMSSSGRDALQAAADHIEALEADRARLIDLVTWTTQYRDKGQVEKMLADARKEPSRT